MLVSLLFGVVKVIIVCVCSSWWYRGISIAAVKATNARSVALVP